MLNLADALSNSGQHLASRASASDQDLSLQYALYASLSSSHGSNGAASSSGWPGGTSLDNILSPPDKNLQCGNAELVGRVACRTPWGGRALNKCHNELGRDVDVNE